MTTIEYPPRLFDLAPAKPTARSRQAIALWALAILVVCSALLGRLCYLGRPFDYDAAIFIYQGKLIADGGRLCHDLIDNKFPTVGLLTSAAWRAFGANWWMYVALQTTMSIACAGMLARTARRHLGSNATIPTLLFAIAYLNFSTVVFGGFQLETIEIFFGIFAAAAAAEALASDSLRDAFVVGLAGGCAAMAKPTGLAVAGAYAIAVIVCYRRRPIRIIAHGLASAAGLAIPAAATLAYLLASDTLRDMPALWKQLSTYASNTIWSWGDFWKGAVVLSIGGFPMLARTALFRREKIERDQPIASPIVTFIALWLILETLGVIAQRRMYAYHFLPIAAPAALLFGMIPRRIALESLLIPLLPVIVLSVGGAACVIVYRDIGNHAFLENYLRNHASRPDAVVWMDYTSRLMLETDFRPGSRHALTFLFVNSDESARRFSGEIIDDFRSRRPEFIVLPGSMDAFLENQRVQVAELDRSPTRRASYNAAWRSIESFTKQNYCAEVNIARWTVYRRADLAARAITSSASRRCPSPSPSDAAASAASCPPTP